MNDDRRHDQDRDSVNDRATEEVAADVQPGVGTGPGEPPAMGTGERARTTTSPPTGRVDAQRATWGADEAVPGAGSLSEPPQNVGGSQGDRPGDAVADFPADETDDRAGFPPVGDR